MNDIPSFAGQTRIDTHSARVGENPSEAKVIVTPMALVPPNPIAGRTTNDTHDVVAGDPHHPPGAKVGAPPSDALSRAGDICAEIRILHRRAKFCTRQRVAIGNRLAAFVRVEFLGFSTFADETSRAKAVAAAQKLLSAVRKGKPTDLPPDDELALRALVTSTDTAMEPFEELEKRCTKRMVKLARELPGYRFVQGTLGFGEVSFARIIGETGPLHAYANPAKVWKRLGLAVIAGERQRRYSDPDLAAAHGYNPSRRSVSWVAFEPVLKAQGASNQHREYRTLYDEAKARYLERGWTKMHAHRAASRYAEKRLVRDLWRAWRDEIGGGHLIDDAHHARAAADHLGIGHHGADAQADSADPDLIAEGQATCDAHPDPALGDPIGGGQIRPDILCAGAAADPLHEAA